jgi:ribonuclease HI
MPESVSAPTFVKAIYTDGACSGNPGPGGWGVVVQFTNGQHHELGGGVTQTTNNQMELQAAIEAVKALKILPQRAAGACVYTDSEYVKNGITKWLENWKKRGWKTAQGKPVLNQELWKALDELNPLQIEWQYIKAHAGHPGNERADAIARAFSLKQSPRLAQMDGTDIAAQTAAAPNGSDGASVTLDAPTGNRPNPQPDAPIQLSLEEPSSLHKLMTALQCAETIADRGFLITSSELAELVNLDVATLAARGDQWTWRNWKVSCIRKENDRPLWQLERVHPVAAIPNRSK